MGKCLSDLTVYQRASEKCITFSSANISYKGSISSTPTKLIININNFDGCLCLYPLNGYLQSLSTLIIRINRITRTSSQIDNTLKLVKLKCFSLSTDGYTYYYDNQVVPLLRRMLNLKELNPLILMSPLSCLFSSISMQDTRPFEHKLFQILSQDFPFLQQLTIFNDEPLKNDQYHSSTLITFNHLFKLNLWNTHNDYVIQFLSDKNTCLPCLTNLIIDYETLTIVTNNFINDATFQLC